ncbi:MAG: hypothetical protein [Escherichia phage RP3]|jgi:hypothetical protein|uniref:Uncharacterized protein n=96 Tax=Viruses TaxID=10239 RepID=Q6KGB3_BPFO1|nr:hypothetical protein [Salmonella phage FelixO1]YP_002922890.1 hypothetical protein WV8_gp108 [Escherichia phage wV8]YP_009147368.1 hypothetical protein ACQ43_gp079 [Escherichia phage vB_EcoM-VpaE1]YP_009150145.1 hypothetical protein Phi87_94 [Enterobacteria phage UAB_Phi87]YP_009205001.1 hypothetical protein AVV39_gp098 [Escherichia phage HY02]YP_009621541.1 hypothetical protein FDJ21_gp055 [Salmonella phage BPS17L1]AEO97517.1 gp99 [Salmonella phage FO1a]AGF88704.1 hypothetical protein SP
MKMRVKDNFKVIDHRLVELSSLSNEVMIERLKRVESRRKEIADEIHELDKIENGLKAELQRRGANV